MDARHAGGGIGGKRLKATARFVATYGRLPSEFDPDIAMGLSMNIPAIEAAQTLSMARAISIAFGDADALGDAIYATTGNGRLAQRSAIAMKRSMEASRVRS